MTIATKNGAIIVKDGKLAENCGCCGDWYCCPSNLCPQDAIASVTVTLATVDYLEWAKQGYSGNTWFHTSLGFLGSLYNGSHALTKQSSGTQWLKTFPAQPDASCTASLLFSVSQSTWSLVFSWHVLAYGLFAAESAGVYKELSEMKCFGFPDYNAGYPNVPPPPGTASLSGSIGQCFTINNTAQSLTFAAVLPRGALFGDANSPAIEVLRVDGTNTATMSVSVTALT